MEKFKSLLSFTLGICLTSTTFKVLCNSLNIEEKTTPLISETIAAEPVTPVSIAMLEESVAKKTPDPVAVVSESEKILDKAIMLYKKEIDKDSNRPDLWKRIADIENQKKNHPNAIEALKNAIKLQPKNAALYVSLSDIYAATNQSEEAVSAIDQALKLLNIEPENNETQIVAQAEPTEEIIPEALIAESEKNWDKAIRLHKEEIAKNPNRPDLWKRISDIENQQQHYQNAIEALNNAIKLQPKNATLYVSLSETYAVTNQPKEAVFAINQALEIEPTNVDYLNRKVILTNWLGDYDQTEDSYKRILNIEPNNQVAQLGLQNIQAEREKAKLNANTSTVGEKPVVVPEVTVETPGLKPSDPIEITTGSKLDFNTQSNTKSSASVSGRGAEYARQAQEYSDTNRPQEALLYINLAITKEPHNMAYHKLRAEMALVEKNYALAKESYCYMLQRERYNKDALLGMANLEVQRNNLDEAVCAYEDYLALYPDSKTVWLDYAKLQSWRGNYVAAFNLIREYKDRYGETYQYLSTKARLFSMAGYPEHALSLVNCLLNKSPNDYEVRFTEAAALEGHRESDAAQEALCKIERKFPKNEDNKELRNYILTPSRSSLTLNGYGYRDTDHIKMLGSGFEGEYVLTPETSVIYGARQENSNAIIDSGLDTIDGHSNIWDSAQWVGLKHQISPEIGISALGGIGEISKRKSFFRYDLNINTNPNDYIQIAFQKGQDLYAVSPRAVSLRILQRYNRMSVNWQPYIQKFLSAGVEYSHFSDKNKLKGLFLNPYATIWASQYVDINFGPYANWQKFSTQTDSGYYDPSFSQLYQGLGQITFKQSENINYILTLAAGTQKDETMLKRGFAGDIALKAIYGIYADWQFDVSAAATARNSGSLLEGSGTRYRAYTIQTSLTKRF